MKLDETLTLDDYQTHALRTKGNPDDFDRDLAILGLGIAGEAGEVADALKKVIGHGHPLDREKLAKEIGDVLWYAATLSAALGLPLSMVAGMNVEKLRARYPEGFDSERSKNRTEADRG